MSESQLKTAGSRLSIAHLLAWTAGIAIVLAVFRWVRQIDSGYAPTGAQQLGQFAYGLCYGAGICGLALFGVRRLRQSAHGPSQPGHWMLTVLGIAGLIDGAALLGGTWLKGYSHWFEGGPGLYWIWIAQIASAQIAAAAAFGVAFNGWGGATRPWRRFAIGLAVNLAVHSALLLYQWVVYKTWTMPLLVEITLTYLPVVGVPVVLVLLVLAARNDTSQKRSRDWLHFTGLSAVALFGCTHLALHVWATWVAA